MRQYTLERQQLENKSNPYYKKVWGTRSLKINDQTEKELVDFSHCFNWRNGSFYVPIFDIRPG